jgi:hypothetical protein
LTSFSYFADEQEARIEMLGARVIIVILDERLSGLVIAVKGRR